MLESFNTNSEMQYQRLTEDEKQRRGILGRLVGIIADFKNSTRNGRKYTEELWERTFNDPIVKEKLENRCLLGELGHPADRQEIDIEKVAICLAEMPKKGSDGKLHGVFDILDTPNGRILKTLCDYGCNIGVSSRGGGDTYEDFDGQETVDANTYEFECFDAVLLPAVQAARPQYVTESLNTRKTLKVALQEELERSNDTDKEIMKNTLNELKIDYATDTAEMAESDDNIVTEDDAAAEDVGVSVINELQEALQRQQELEAQVRSLQEKLSVCYTKETRYRDRLGKANSAVTAHESENKLLSEKVARLEDQVTGLNEHVSKLVESVQTKDTKINELTTSLSGYRERFSSVQSELKELKSRKTILDESVSSKSQELTKLQESYKSLRETSEKKISTLVAKTTELESTNSKLVEQLNEEKKDSQIVKSQQTAKLQKAQELVEKYKTIAKTAVEKYMSLQASKIGVSVSDIKGRLNESYSFKDIDKACDDLQQYKLKLNSLPFTTLTEASKVKMTIKESKDRRLDKASYGDVDDDIDVTLLNFTQ